jgi:hypothetical protein
MQITWADKKGNAVSGRIEAHIAPIVGVLGQDRTADFLMKFSGHYVNLNENPQDRNPLLDLLTRAEISALGKALSPYLRGGGVNSPSFRRHPRVTFSAAFRTRRATASRF